MGDVLSFFLSNVERIFMCGRKRFKFEVEKIGVSPKTRL